MRIIGSYWLIERNKLHGEPNPIWFSHRITDLLCDINMWVRDATKAQKFETKEEAEQAICDQFKGSTILPIATENIDCDWIVDPLK